MGADQGTNLTSSSRSGVIFSHSFVPVVSSSGRLQHGMHRQLDLARPAGTCAGNVGLRAVGNVMRYEDTFVSLGQCCDLCVKTTGCSAWSFEKHRCFLINTFAEDVIFKFEAHAFSGLNIAW